MPNSCMLNKCIYISEVFLKSSNFGKLSSSLPLFDLLVECISSGQWLCFLTQGKGIPFITCLSGLPWGADEDTWKCWWMSFVDCLLQGEPASGRESPWWPHCTLFCQQLKHITVWCLLAYCSPPSVRAQLPDSRHHAH